MKNDIFETRQASPMLISNMLDPFDSVDYLYEIKFDGSRCLAYLDSDVVDLRDKRNHKRLGIAPELGEINKQVKGKCILDGELVVFIDGKADFYELQRREMLNDPFKIRLGANRKPITFVAYDILYLDGKDLSDKTLLERKIILNETITENDYIILSRAYERDGRKLFDLVKEQKLEGVVAKLKKSKYSMGKRSKEWIKFKVMTDEEFVVCGYIKKENNMVSLVIGNYHDGELVYKGHVTLGVNLERLLMNNPDIISYCPITEIPKGNEEAVWLKPELVCTVQYMTNEENRIRQPVFKGFRKDKIPAEVVE